jgi:phosphatidylserine decarboxylase
MIATDGWRFIIPLWALSILLAVLWIVSGSGWWLIPLVLVGFFALFVTYFFRDPERSIPEGDGLVLSPGDGRIIVIEDIEDAGTKLRLVSIFLSVFDVHVNRIPISGRVVDVTHTPGKFHKAFEREAVTENERTQITIEHDRGQMRFAQVAGILARRVVCDLTGGEEVVSGQRFGLIRFGSRVDLFLDPQIKLRVELGDRVKGGESVIGVYPNHD